MFDGQNDIENNPSNNLLKINLVNNDGPDTPPVSLIGTRPPWSTESKHKTNRALSPPPITGTRSLQHGGYSYWFAGLRKGLPVTEFWRCTHKQKVHRCAGRMHVTQGQAYHVVTPHNHEPKGAGLKEADFTQFLEDVHMNASLEHVEKDALAFERLLGQAQEIVQSTTTTDTFEAEAIHLEDCSQSLEDSPGGEGGSEDSGLAGDSASLSSSGLTPSNQKKGSDRLPPFQCTFCVTVCDTYNELKIHEQEHASLMPYQCRHCNKGFKHKRSQERHELLHSGVRPFKCVVCPAAFFRSDHLKVHSRTHGADQTLDSLLGLDAATCSESFDPTSDLPPTVCSICGEQFSTSDQLLDHLDAKHGTEGTQTDNSLNGQSTTSMALEAQPITVHSQQTQELVQVHSGQKSTMFGNNQQRVNRRKRKAPHPHASGAALDMGNMGADLSCRLCGHACEDVAALQTHTLTKHVNNQTHAHANQTTHWTSSRPSSTGNSIGNENVLVNGSGERRYACEHCERTFDGLLKLHEHTSAVHTSPNANAVSTAAVQCDLCAMPCADHKLLHKHMLLAHAPLTVQSSSSVQQSETCEVCGQCFRDHSTLYEHVMSVHYARKRHTYNCVQCSTTLDRPDLLHKHMMDSHVQLSYKCSVCKHSTDTQADMRLHVQSAHSSAETVTWRCARCYATFSSRPQLERHVASVHVHSLANYINGNTNHYKQTSRFSCAVCSRSFESFAAYEYHTNMAHSNDTANENGLDASPLFSNSLGRAHGPGHKSTQSGNTPNTNGNAHSINSSTSKCNICDNQFESIEQLSHHKLHVHCKVRLNNTCHFCQHKMHSYEDFTLHTKEHNRNRGPPVSCVVCRQSLMSPFELEAHALFHLGQTNPPKVECDSSPSPHLHTVNGNAPNLSHNNPPSVSESPSHGSVHLSCPSCPNKFTAHRELIDHQMNGTCPGMSQQDTTQRDGPILNGTMEDGAAQGDTDVKELPYQCIKCQQSFGTEAAIQRHVATHVLQEGVGNNCMLCHRVFTSPSKLQCHLIEHCFVDGSDYVCGLCGQLFSNAPGLQQHTYTHELTDRPFDCAVCHQKFFFRSELDNHMLLFHQNEMGLLDIVNDSDTQLPRHDAEHTQTDMEMDSELLGADQDQSLVFGDDSLGLDNADLQPLPFLVTPTKRNPVNRPRKRHMPALFSGSTSLEQNSVSVKSESYLDQVASGAQLTPNRHMQHGNGMGSGRASAQPRTKSRTQNRPRHTLREPTVVTAELLAQMIATDTSPSNPNNIHQCPHCPKAFQSLAALQGHSHVHMNVTRNHKCTSCDKAFATGAKLRNHQRQHRGDKPHVCEVCGKNFSRKDNLKVHVKQHYRSGYMSHTSSALSPLTMPLTPLSPPVTDVFNQLPTMVSMLI